MKKIVAGKNIFAGVASAYKCWIENRIAEAKPVSRPAATKLAIFSATRQARLSAGDVSLMIQMIIKSRCRALSIGLGAERGHIGSLLSEWSIQTTVAKAFIKALSIL